MTTLSKATTEYLQAFIDGVVDARQYNEPIDEQYDLRFDPVILARLNKIIITYTWFPGKSKQPREPWMAVDDPKPLEDVFELHQSESFRKLTKEIMDAIDEVTKEPFNPVMEREA